MKWFLFSEALHLLNMITAISQLLTLFAPVGICTSWGFAPVGRGMMHLHCKFSLMLTKRNKQADEKWGLVVSV
jgi:hypothetical protein